VSEDQKEKWANPAAPIHHAVAAWAAACAERALPIFEELHPDDARPRAAVDALHAWMRGEIPMTACRAAAFAAHAAAREAETPAAVAAARAAGQASAVAHMFDHSPHAATYAAKAVGLHRGDAARAAEREWQWAHLAPELREIGFPRGL
jgi:hypothetical protein